MRKTPENENEHERKVALSFTTRAGTVTLRAEQPGDEAFLFEVYASTRQDELNLTPWNEAMRQAFLTQQFRAMRQGYAEMFPNGAFSIILLDGRPIGRQVVHHNDERICVADVALLPAYQCQGIGRALMESVLRDAAAAKLPVRLHVVRENRALNLYRRLGFEPIGELGVYQEMEWRVR
ncbi:MAG TPA: GNAT family N-acetyltransferase [Verrucomicrobiae bacterium]|nr:GNAT family N-acetyltransferase [Verrucomicrobiae bacterium]